MIAKMVRMASFMVVCVKFCCAEVGEGPEKKGEVVCVKIMAEKSGQYFDEGYG